MQITVQEVTSQYVQKGRNGYTQLDVVYSSNGKNGTKKIFSFSNPAVFNTLKDATQGSNWEVSSKQNDKGFWDWTAVEPAGQVAAPTSGRTGVGGKVVGSNYETADERKLKQLYIIKQSSIANAISMLNANYTNAKDSKKTFSIEEVLETAQKFVDFVYGNEDVDLFEQPNELPED